MTKFKILLAEDEPALGQIIKDSLETKSYEVVWFENGQKALNHFEKNKFDLVILDVMMPIMDGFSCAKKIRTINKDIPIIFLTAKSQAEDVVKGFESGCHDYIKKPFSLLELFVRIESILKRINPKHENKTKFGKFIFDENQQLICIDNEYHKLSHKESEILKILLKDKNELIDRKVILQRIWGNTDYFSGRSLDVYVSRLRKLLAKDSRLQIINLRGVGYKMVVY